MLLLEVLLALLNFGLLLFRLLLVASENQLGVDRQRIEQEVEPFAVLVRIARAQVQPVVVLVLALDDGVGAICRLFAMMASSNNGLTTTPRVGSRAGRDAPRQHRAAA